MAVLAAHPLIIPRPVAPRPFRPGQFAVGVSTALTKVRGQYSTALRHQTVTVGIALDPHGNVAMDAMADVYRQQQQQQQQQVVQARQVQQQAPPPMQPPPPAPVQYQQPPVQPHHLQAPGGPPRGLRNARQASAIRTCRPQVGRLRALLHPHSSTPHHRGNSRRLRSNRQRMRNRHTHMPMRRHRRYIMRRRWATACSSRRCSNSRSRLQCNMAGRAQTAGIITRRRSTRCTLSRPNSNGRRISSPSISTHTEAADTGPSAPGR
jgi:hypothetical protein